MLASDASAVNSPEFNTPSTSLSLHTKIFPKLLVSKLFIMLLLSSSSNDIESNEDVP